MAERARCSTRALKADEAFCRQVARLLFADAEPIRRAFLGELVKEVLALVDWALAHEDDPRFDAGRALEAWAKKRRRGCYGQSSGSPRTAAPRPDTNRCGGRQGYGPQPGDEVGFGYGVGKTTVLTGLERMAD